MCFPIVAAILSGVLLVLSFPRYDMEWLAWVALVPLLLGISGRSVKYGFLASGICGITFFTGFFSWLFEVRSYSLFHHALLGLLYLGPLFGIFGLLYGHITRRWGLTPALGAAPFIWVSLEYIRANFLFLAIPTAIFGHTQYQHPALIQFVSITGDYGLSFLIVWVNAAISAAILRRLRGRYLKPASALPSKSGTIAMLSLAAAMIGMAMIYGQMTLSRSTGQPEVKVSVLQGNIAQANKWDPKFARVIMSTYLDLSKAASKDRPALIVWPEAATPGFILKNMELLRQTKELVQQTKTHYLIGSSEYPKFQKSASDQNKTSNSALFFSPDGKILGQYLKIRLFPFAEYVPYEKTIRWPEFIVPEERRRSHVAGKEFNLFEINEAKFGVVICWEIAFPGVFRKFVKSGADFMINITNEAWFRESSYPYQYVAISVLRAVENRVAIARSANTGITCFIDPFGRVTDKLQDENGKDLFIKGYLTGNITLSRQKTFYTTYGDVFVNLVLVITASVLIIALLSRSSR